MYALEKGGNDDMFFDQRRAEGLTMRFEREVKVGAQTQNAQSKSSKPNKGKGKVKQLAYAPSLGLLLSRCDGAIEVWNAHALQPASPVPLAENAGVKLFALDATPRAERLAVLTKKTAWLFAWAASRQWVALTSFPLPEEALQCALSGHALAIATRKAYVLLDTRSGKATELFAYSHTPVLAPTPEGDTLCAQERLGLVVNAQGVAARASYTFAAPPLDALVAPPYALAAHAHGVEVLDAHSGSALQTLPLRGLGSSDSLQPRLCRAPAVVLVYALGGSGVAALRALPIGEQVTQMIALGDVKRALELYMRTSRADPDFKQQLRHFHALAADALFRRADFAAAFGYWRTSDVSPLSVLARFPQLLPASLVPQGVVPVTQVVVQALVEDGKRGAARRELSGVDAHTLVAEAKRQLAQYLEFAVAKHKKEPALLMHLERAATLLSAELGADAFKRRLSELSAAHTLHSDELTRALEQAQRWGALALLYEHNGDLTHALALWERLSSGELQDAATSPSQALSEAVRALSVSNSWPLLQRYTPWLAAQPQGLSLVRTVYMNNEREENTLPHALVVDTLKKYAGLEQAYLEYLVNVLDVRERRFHVQLSALYLQHVLRAQQSASPQERSAADAALARDAQRHRVSTQLLQQQQLLGLDDDDIRSGASARTGGDDTAGDADSDADSASYLGTRRRLLRFLQQSQLYDPAPLVAHLERAGLTEELLVVLTRLGEHERALGVLLHDLKDLERAEHYCVHWRPEYVRGSDDFAYDAHTKAALDYHSAPTGTNPYLQSLFKLYASASTPDDVDGLAPKARELLAKVPLILTLPLTLSQPQTNLEFD